jgi:glutathione S-transferase
VFSQISDELATFAYQQVAADDAGLKAALTIIEGLVRGPFCAGAVPTQGDYLLAAVVKKLPAGATAGFPKVAAAFEAVKALPKVAAFNGW